VDKEAIVWFALLKRNFAPQAIEQKFEIFYLAVAQQTKVPISRTKTSN